MSSTIEPIARLRVGPFGCRKITLYPDRIERGTASYPLIAVQAEVTGGVLTDPLLAIAGPGFVWHHQVDRFRRRRARLFAAQVNACARQSGWMA